MAQGIYRGVSSVARKVTKMYRGVSAVARAVKYGYRGVSSVARQFFNGTYILQYTSKDDNISNNFTINTYSANITDGVLKIILKVTGKTTSNDEILNRLYLLNGTNILAGKQITFEYTNTNYDVRDFTCEFNCYDVDWNKLSQNALSVTSTYTSKSYTIPANTYRVCFGYWCKPDANDTWSGTLCVKNVVIGGVQII